VQKRNVKREFNYEPCDNMSVECDNNNYNQLLSHLISSPGRRLCVLNKTERKTSNIERVVFSGMMFTPSVSIVSQLVFMMLVCVGLTESWDGADGGQTPGSMKETNCSIQCHSHVEQFTERPTSEQSVLDFC
jgi:hypothetical protein